MIICICNRLSERQLCDEVQRGCGHATVEDLYRCLGCDIRCGQCVCYAEDILERQIGQAANAPVAQLRGAVLA